MRATINFEADVDRVHETMGALAREELQPLHQAMDLVETTKPQDLHQGLSEALEILGAVSSQLAQYRDMITSFEKARFETLLPQPADSSALMETIGEVKEAANIIEKFDDFLGQIGQEVPNGGDPEEG